MARRSFTQKSKALVFLGPGDSTNDNTSDLLDDFLDFPARLDDDEGALLFVHSGNKPSGGLASVLNWIDQHELVYEVQDVSGQASKYHEFAEHTHSDPDFDVIEWLKGREDLDPYIIALWGEEGDTATADVLRRATAAEIPVLDLTAGLDNLILEEVSEETTPEPEPEEKPKRGRPRKTPPVEEPTVEVQEVEATEQDEISAEEEKPKRGRPRKTAAVQETTVDHTRSEGKAASTEDVTVSAIVTGEFFDLNKDVLALIEKISAQFLTRELALTVTKLEEASFWLGRHFHNTNQVKIEFTAI